jgi:hypothetical protein
MILLVIEVSLYLLEKKLVKITWIEKKWNSICLASWGNKQNPTNMGANNNQKRTDLYQNVNNIQKNVMISRFVHGC